MWLLIYSKKNQVCACHNPKIILTRYNTMTMINFTTQNSTAFENSFLISLWFQILHAQILFLVFLCVIKNSLIVYEFMRNSMSICCVVSSTKFLSFHRIINHREYRITIQLLASPILNGFLIFPSHETAARPARNHRRHSEASRWQSPRHREQERA